MLKGQSKYYPQEINFGVKNGMIESLGWLGFLLLVGVLMPLILRLLNTGQAVRLFFVKNHHFMAMAALGVLTLHGFLVLNGGRGWRWGALNHFRGDLFTGLMVWVVLLAICLLALAKVQRKIHCWLVGLLILLTLLHV